MLFFFIRFNLSEFFFFTLKTNSTKTPTKTWVYFQGLLGVYSGFARADPRLTPNKPKVNTE